MSLVWSLIASFLYVEIFIVLMLVLPVASPQRWQKFFKSRFLAMLSRQAHTYFYLLLFVLVLFLLEAIREMRKYSHVDTDPAAEQHLNVGMQHSMRLFRAQRNFYISGFAIFLSLVIRRLVSLITTQAQLLAQAEASMKQAQSATAAARSMMNQQKIEAETGDKPKPSAPSADEVNVDELKKRVAELEGELARERKDKEAMKSQSESLNREYDRLTEEYSKLQKRITITTNDKSD
ncbi:B-cell receptor-associated protein 31 isoform X1 [Toxorhynchites rutilus septentrionalis]|uniref:B-cell receptor-associated protein 31 isoform X1 n=1 Tax=Toxorhynchites rutilus septentrionalis TaxID=329112 RepID=UPI00247B2257|nr:B-cell receptor-associated protein 31 isoform X1 [Toxorhynchites rutilus septentrionalis]XP_055624620.1 B-cell receptor-associated protein 31 isoform X1 [Toxorhynchites rutilus septentrionalis]